MTIHDMPAVNATLNAAAACLLISGWWCIRRRRIRAHMFCMLSALAMSTLFLVGYLTYHTYRVQTTGVGSTPFPGTGVWKALYFTILIPHIILAAVMLPMIGVVLSRALRGDFARHKRLARITLPIWLYVSVTGVVVYFMLYRVNW